MCIDGFAPEIYQAILDSTADAIVTIDEGGRVMSLNATATRLFGYMSEEVVGRDVSMLAPEPDRSAHPGYLRRYKETGEARVLGREREVTARRKDGSLFPAALRVTEMRHQGRRLFIGTVQDISPRVESDRSRREVDALLTNLAEGTAQATGLDFFRSLAKWLSVCLGVRYSVVAEHQCQLRQATPLAFFRDGEWIECPPYSLEGTPCGQVAAGEVCYVAHGVQTLYPLDAELRTMEAESYLGLPLVSTRGVVLGHIAILDSKPMPDGLRCERVLRIFSARATAELERLRAEDAVHGRNALVASLSEAQSIFLSTGSWVEASRTILTAGLAQTQSQLGFVGAVMEGTKLRVLAHEGLEGPGLASEEFLEAARAVQAREGYLEFDRLDNLFGAVILSGTPMIANDAAASPSRDRLPAGHPQLRHFLGVPVLHGKKVVGLIAVANRPGGYSTAEQERLQMLAGMTGVFYDGYRRSLRETQLEEQLRQSQKMEAIGRLAGGVAHDFNNLLTVILGYARFIEESTDQDSALHRDSLSIIRSAERAAALTHQLLAFGRRQVLLPEILDANKIVHELQGMLRRLISEDVRIELQLEMALPCVRVDPTQLSQVVLNLAVNARDAMPQGGTILIRTEVAQSSPGTENESVPMPPGEYVRLSVRDTGHGMDPQTLSRIFEPFFTTKPQGRGTGLGLATVYGIVKQSGGFIFASSEPGTGTEFRVYLPAIRERAVPESHPFAVEKAPSGHETVLVVEDEEALRSLMRRSLEMAGYTVLEAGNGDEALAVFREAGGPVRLLLTDAVMPGMNGRELAQKLCELTPGLAVMFMSGYTDDEVLLRGVEQASLNFLPKPFKPAELARKVREVIDRTAAGRS